MVGRTGITIITAFAAAVVSTMLANFQVPETLKAADALAGHSSADGQKTTQSRCAKKIDAASGLQMYQPSCK